MFLLQTKIYFCFIQEPRHLQAISDLEDSNIYSLISCKKLYNSPTDFGFCVKVMREEMHNFFPDQRCVFSAECILETNKCSIAQSLQTGIMASGFTVSMTNALCAPIICFFPIDVQWVHQVSFILFLLDRIAQHVMLVFLPKHNGNLKEENKHEQSLI